MAQKPSTPPILRLNTEMHTATIRRISVDARGRYLLTVSEDKTAKLWEVAMGELLRTFRVPISEGNEGMLFAGAISPDGRAVAVAGWTSKDGLNNLIYIFDSTSGQLLASIKGLPNVIFDLDFSPDGQYLAAALGGKNGIRIYQTSDYKLYAEDTDYESRTGNIAYDHWGRLASVSYDGQLRVYDEHYQLQKKTRTLAGKRPFSVVFSPDGNKIAVGYSDSPTIQVFDANTLQVLYEPDITSADTMAEQMMQVAFSADGRYLAAGYSYSKYNNNAWWRQIRLWEQAGQGAYQDYDAASLGVMDIKALPNGSFVFGSARPDWGIIDPGKQQRTIYVAAEIFKYNTTDQSHFCLGRDGLSVGVKPVNQKPLVFSLAKRLWEQKESTDAGYRDEKNGISITDWKANYHPKWNGKELNCLEAHEISRSVDIARGGQGIVLGTEWYIRCFDARRQERWSKAIPGAAWCVKIDPHNQVVAAALGDGTIRWYRFRDGEPLLTLFLHPDGERWVLWTRSGYYDCAPGAENLIGWHVNNGAEQAASYFPVSRFRDTYYRPDIIDSLLESWDEQLAIADANRQNNRRGNTLAIEEQLPPTVRILQPMPDTLVEGKAVKLAYTIESPNGELITNQRILLDGRPVAVQRGTKPLNKELQETVDLPDEDCTVSIIVENRFGASEATSIPIRRRGMGRAPAAAADVVAPSVYILAIGVNEYAHNDITNLGFAAKDATDFSQLMQKQEGLLYKKVETQLLTNADATKDNILDGLDWLQRETTSRDIAILFFAGHGADDNSSNFYYLPANANPNGMRRTCIPKGEVQTTVASVAGKIVVFMDACHSGGLMRETRRRNLPPDVIGVINELVSAENGAVVFSSATSRQYALESDEWENGAFTKALLEGLKGKAKSGNSNKITVKTLDAYVAERVKKLTGGKQSPATVYPPNVPDFPIGIVS